MHDDLGIRLALKAVAPGDQLLAQTHIVLDDAVVHHGEAAVVAQMGMGVGIRGSAVGGPAGMADAGDAGHGASVVRFLAKAGDPARDLAQMDLRAVHHSDPRGVITPVFELFQSVQQDRRRFLGPGKSDDSTHNDSPFLIDLLI